MRISEIISVSGCITKEKFIAGRTLVEIEKILGFHKGRLAGGIAVVALTELPNIDDFDVASYSNVATHRHQLPSGLDIQKLKGEAMKTWATVGFERLVKVLPTIRHNPELKLDIQYPPGHGAPQWVVKENILLRGKVVGVVGDYPAGRYLAADPAQR